MEDSFQSHLFLDHFRRQGYAIVRDGVSPDRTTECLVSLRRLFEASAPPVRRDSAGNTLRLCAVATREDGRIMNSLLTSRVRLALRTLLGPNVLLLLNRHNHASPARAQNANVRFHRDTLQWSRSVVTAIFYLESASVSQGCTWIVPGSHYFPQVGDPNNGGTWLDEQPAYRTFADQALPVPASPGDVLLFDSLVYHTAGKNETDGTRWAVVAAFRSADELAATTDPSAILVEGQALYRGNELQDDPPGDWRSVHAPSIRRS